MESAESPLKLLATTDKIIVGLVEFQGRLILATSDGVYYLDNDKFKPIKIVDADVKTT